MPNWSNDAFFQSTLLQEERRLENDSFEKSIFFQSTLLQEERRFKSCVMDVSVQLSIHAPTRGATAKMHNIPYASLQ